MSNRQLYGFGPSVYTRVIRIVLAEKQLDYDFHDVNPFEATGRAALDALHPFKRVPVLDDRGFVVYESAAIAVYIDTAYPDHALTPTDPKAAARMTQVIRLVDGYGYWPMVRQVFGHCVFRQSEGLDTNDQHVAQGLGDAEPVLDALEQIAVEGLVLGNGAPTLAECHLAPMIAAFSAAPEGAAALARRTSLSRWWQGWSRRPSILATDTGFDRPRPRISPNVSFAEAVTDT